MKKTKAKGKKQVPVFWPLFFDCVAIFFARPPVSERLKQLFELENIGRVTFYCKCVTFTMAGQYLYISYQNPKQGRVTQNHTFFFNLRWTLYFVPASSLTLNLPLIVTLAPFLSGTGSGEIVMSLIFTGEPPSITEYVK